mmetsp:Transcript_14342/g.42823  ORF Transcript_14342/g.42823 Transcript_14342/m.42823 type:complete len:218 (+) Transcript_14342:592-1245(+)
MGRQKRRVALRGHDLATRRGPARARAQAAAGAAGRGRRVHAQAVVGVLLDHHGGPGRRRLLPEQVVPGRPEPAPGRRGVLRAQARQVRRLARRVPAGPRGPVPRGGLPAPDEPGRAPHGRVRDDAARPARGADALGPRAGPAARAAGARAPAEPVALRAAELAGAHALGALEHLRQPLDAPPARHRGRRSRAAAAHGQRVTVDAPGHRAPAAPHHRR